VVWVYEPWLELDRVRFMEWKGGWRTAVRGCAEKRGEVEILDMAVMAGHCNKSAKAPKHQNPTTL
jgi:hypothetical protein